MIIVDRGVGLDFYEYDYDYCLSKTVPSDLSVADSSDPLLIMPVMMTDV